MHKSHERSARVRHILASHSGQGKPAPKKRSGGACGTSRIYSRGNDSAEHMQDMPAEGHKGKSRYAKGGHVGKRPMKVQINHINVAHPGMMGAGGPPMPAGAPMGGPPPMAAGPGPGLLPPGMAPGMPPMARNQGGAVHAGSGTGVSRLSEYHRLKGEGR
jgi:hypothetical protein